MTSIAQKTIQIPRNAKLQLNKKGNEMAMRLVLALLLVMCPICFKGSDNISDFYEYCSGLPSDTLLAKGGGYLGINEKDSAFLCYNIIVSRHDKQLDRHEKKLCLEACIKQWQIYFFKFFDNRMSLGILSKAKEIASDLDMEVAEIDLCYGIVYADLLNQKNTEQQRAEAMRHLRSALRKAAANKDERHIADYAFGNLVLVAADSTEMKDISADWNLYGRSPPTHPTATAPIMSFSMKDTAACMPEDMTKPLRVSDGRRR